MKKVLLYLIVCFSLLACGKDSKQKKCGCITGKVTFYNTGKVANAYVRLMQSETSEAIYSGKIGSMGNYNIDNIEPGSYIFKVYKMGFIDTIFPEKIRIQPAYQNDNKCRQMDWAIMMPVVELKPLRVLDVNTNMPVDTLNFGTTADRLYFKIRNDNNVACQWESDFWNVRSGAQWLSSMEPQSGSVNPYSEKVISVKITRNLSWSEPRGEKAAVFKIESNMGGWVITVLANYR